jgi:Spy/CpxP family protein refolding chaperone
MFNRSKFWAAALLAAAFGAGAMAGWAIQASADPGGRDRRRGTDAMVNYLAGELDLTAAQRDSVRAVFDRHRPAMKALWETVHPQMDSLRSAMRAAIAAQLTPSQQRRYQGLIADQERRHRHDSTKATDTTTRGVN